MSASEGGGGAVSRPSSLVLEGAAPEREPLRFDVRLVGAPPEVEQLVQNIKQVAEDFLYHWKTFPIVLPPSRFTGPGCRPSDIIIAPPCDELDAAALDAGLEQNPLSHKQLHSIREKGEFEVPSRHFPGQTHVWRVAGWLARGRARARTALLRVAARAAQLLLVRARDLLVASGEPSARAGVRQLCGAAHRLLDLLIGMPSLAAHDLDRKIEEERSRYLVAELICKGDNAEDIAALASWVSRAMRGRRAGDCAPARDPPPVPCCYTTPQGIEVDLRLYRPELVRRARPVLQGILERESRGWFLHYREKMAADLAALKMPMSEIEKEVRAAGLREYVSRVCARVESHAELRALGARVPELLRDQLHATAILNRARDEVAARLQASHESYSARIACAHPVLTHAQRWRGEKLDAHDKRQRDELRWTAYEEAAAAMLSHKLHQHRYFLLRDLAFQRDRAPLLMKELRAAQTPTRTYVWRTHRAAPPAPAAADITTSTRYPLYRLAHQALRTYTWSYQLMFLLGVMVPWCSPLSIRTLVCIKPFLTDYQLSLSDGCVYTVRSATVPTVWSRLRALWRHVSKERTRFETEPDTGLLGKEVHRHLHRAWYYGAVGGLGSAALLTLMPLAAVLVSAVSLLCCISVPLWVPPLAVLTHVLHICVYDQDDPNNRRRWFPLLEVVVLRFLVLGVLQVAGALVTALVICPLLALFVLVGGVAWCLLRSLWEELAWRLLIRRHARVPAHDSVFCRRVAGPHLRQTTYYALSCAQAVVAVMARAELEALGAWARRAEAAVDKPLADYRHFVDACFGPFSVQITRTGTFKQLECECASLGAELREKVAARRRDLALGLPQAVRERVRMTSQDLRRAIQTSARELARTVPAGGGGGGGGDVADWWAARGLAPGDWHALAAYMLVQVFSGDILLVLEESAARLELEAGGGARAWAALCARDDDAHHAPSAQPPPDVLVHDAAAAAGFACGWGEAPLPRVPPPSLEPHVFSPRSYAHPPLPPPAAVALVLHNRESESPVPLESELCAEILRGLEDAPDCDDVRVERYRGGGGGGAGSDDASLGTAASDGTLDDDPPAGDHSEGEPSRVSALASRGLCRWTLSGRGVRLRARADLASPEDVTLDIERQAIGTSV